MGGRGEKRAMEKQKADDAMSELNKNLDNSNT